MRLQVIIQAGKNLEVKDIGGSSDPYVKLTLAGKGDEQTKKSKTIKKNTNPQWNEQFDFDVSDPKRQAIIVECFDWDRFSRNDSMGIGLCRIDKLQRGVRTDKWIKLHHCKSGSIHLILTAIDFGNNGPQIQQMQQQMPYQPQIQQQQFQQPPMQQFQQQQIPQQQMPYQPQMQQQQFPQQMQQMQQQFQQMNVQQQQQQVTSGKFILTVDLVNFFVLKSGDVVGKGEFYFKVEDVRYPIKGTIDMAKGDCYKPPSCQLYAIAYKQALLSSTRSITFKVREDDPLIDDTYLKETLKLKAHEPADETHELLSEDGKIQLIVRIRIARTGSYFEYQ